MKKAKFEWKFDFTFMSEIKSLEIYFRDEGKIEIVFRIYGIMHYLDFYVDGPLLKSIERILSAKTSCIASKKYMFAPFLVLCGVARWFIGC